jgi:hypothetical protein
MGLMGLMGVCYPLFFPTPYPLPGRGRLAGHNNHNHISVLFKTYKHRYR